MNCLFSILFFFRFFPLLSDSDGWEDMTCALIYFGIRIGFGLVLFLEIFQVVMDGCSQILWARHSS